MSAFFGSNETNPQPAMHFLSAPTQGKGQAWLSVGKKLPYRTTRCWNEMWTSAHRQDLASPLERKLPYYTHCWNEMCTRNGESSLPYAEEEPPFRIADTLSSSILRTPSHRRASSVFGVVPATNAWIGLDWIGLVRFDTARESYVYVY